MEKVQKKEKEIFAVLHSVKKLKKIISTFMTTFLETCGQTVLPDRSLLIGQKFVGNAKIKKIQMRHFW